MRAGALGVRVQSGGRLGGTEMGRSEWYREGRVPLHTLRAKVDYGTAKAKTTAGSIGVKVWVYHGDEIPYGSRRPSAPAPAHALRSSATRGRAAVAPREPSRPTAAAVVETKADAEVEKAVEKVEEVTLDPIDRRPHGTHGDDHRVTEVTDPKTRGRGSTRGAKTERAPDPSEEAARPNTEGR